MAKQSAGILLFRKIDSQTEFFLAHPGGPFWAKKDLDAWSIPKGEFEPGESPLEAAKREFEEETGYTVDGDFLELKPIKQSSGKIVHIWALEGDCDASKVKSNLFQMEWPPRSGSIYEFPEIDKAGWFSREDALLKIVKGQTGFIEELSQMLED